MTNFTSLPLSICGFKSCKTIACCHYGLIYRKQINGWLVGCFWFNGRLRQYFSIYRDVSQREGERGKKEQMRVKVSKQPPPTASAEGPCPTVIQIVGRPGTGSLHSAIAPPDHSLNKQ